MASRRCCTSRAASCVTSRRCQRPKAAGAARALCSTSGSPWATAWRRSRVRSPSPGVPNPMSDVETLSARIDALEIRVAYQDQVIEDLNAAVTGQWKQIDALLRRIDGLTDRVREAENRATASSAPEPPPPHY